MRYTISLSVTYMSAVLRLLNKAKYITTRVVLVPTVIALALDFNPTKVFVGC